MEDVYNGYISRFINRKISDPIARLLAKTRITPNQVTWAALGVAALSFTSFFYGYNIIGGLLVQLSAIVDGVDGGLARLKGMVTKFGGFLDSVTDRYADGLIILGLILWSSANETYPGTWIVGFMAIVGSICLSYTRARIDVENRRSFDKGLKSAASRDVRLFIMMLGGVSGQVYFCLIIIAVLTNLVVFYRLIYAYKYLGR
jgi:phosphatidylglycerophosphate synthase